MTSSFLGMPYEDLKKFKKKKKTERITGARGKGGYVFFFFFFFFLGGEEGRVSGDGNVFQCSIK